MTAGHDADRPALALFAAELRAARQHAGLTRDELSAKVNYAPSGTSPGRSGPCGAVWLMS
jgi:hypothetical protein